MRFSSLQAWYLHALRFDMDFLFSRPRRCFQKNALISCLDAGADSFLGDIITIAHVSYNTV